MQQMKTKPRRLTEIALLTALALIIFLVEAQIPVIVAIPGIKLGLANMVVLFAIFWLGKKEALLVLLLRIFLGSILVGQVVSLAYSLTGGLLSFLVMAAASHWLTERQIWAAGILGALSHNVGQILVAWFFTGSVQVFWYLPILLLVALGTGLLTGVLSQVVLRALRRYHTRSN